LAKHSGCRSISPTETKHKGRAGDDLLRPENQGHVVVEVHPEGTALFLQQQPAQVFIIVFVSG
jgi:hypothetical protein